MSGLANWSAIIRHFGFLSAFGSAFGPYCSSLLAACLEESPAFDDPMAESTELALIACQEAPPSGPGPSCAAPLMGVFPLLFMVCNASLMTVWCPFGMPEAACLAYGEANLFIISSDRHRIKGRGRLHAGSSSCGPIIRRHADSWQVCRQTGGDIISVAERFPVMR